MQDLRKGVEADFQGDIWIPGTYSISPCDNLEEKSSFLVQQCDDTPDTSATEPKPIKTENPNLLWTTGLTLKLIGLVGDYQDQLHDPKKKKLIIWRDLATKMSDDFEITNIQCETRWRYLLKKYKEFIANKNQTGAARKDFKYREEMSRVLENRPDIFPPLLVGTNVDLPEAESSQENTEKRPAETSSSADETKVKKRARTGAQSPTMLSLLDLPSELLVKIFVLSSNEAFALVCKRFRNLRYSLIKQWKWRGGSLSNYCGLACMTNLFKLTVYLTHNSFGQLISCLDQSQFRNLKYVHIHNLACGYKIVRLSESLKRFDLRALELPEAQLSFKQMKGVFFTLPTLRYYCVPMEYYEVKNNLKEVAAFINDRIHSHNFSLDLIGNIPSELLPYPRHMYRKF